jgi:hypothetical protein
VVFKVGGCNQSRRWRSFAHNKLSNGGAVIVMPAMVGVVLILIGVAIVFVVVGVIVVLLRINVATFVARAYKV